MAAYAEAEVNQGPLKYKTWVLRVGIHCEGCKRKVKKIIKNIDGVYTINIDLRQQKVTVIGDIDAETLIGKLIKNGKHAELWPESKARKKNNKAKNKEKQLQQQSDQESSDEGNDNPSKKETVKVEVTVQGSSKNENGGCTGKNVEANGAVFVIKVNDVGSTGKPSVQVKESKPEVKQTVTFSPDLESPVGDDSEGVVEIGAGGGGPKKRKKKKKKKDGNVNVTFEGVPAGGAPAGTGSPIHGPYGPSQWPHPSSPAHQQASPKPSYYTLNYATPKSSCLSQPSDSFEIMSDENPNACSIM